MAGYYKAKTKKRMAVTPDKMEEAMERGKPDNEKAEIKMPFNPPKGR